MKFNGFLKKLGLCALSAALCVSVFASCDKDDEEDKKIDGDTDISATQPEQNDDKKDEQQNDDKKDDEKDDNKKDDDENSGVVLTADTDFGALVSEKIDAAGWAKAFNADSYENFTASSASLNVLQKATATCSYLQVDQPETKLKLYFYKNEDGKYMGMSGGKVMEMPANDTHYVRDGKPLAMNYSCICPDFSAFFAKFTYDETKKSYVYEGEGLRTNAYYGTGGSYADYVKAELKIVNGLVAYVSTEDTNKNKIATKFYDFGVTAVDLPEISK